LISQISKEKVIYISIKTYTRAQLSIYLNVTMSYQHKVENKIK